MNQTGIVSHQSASPLAQNPQPALGGAPKSRRARRFHASSEECGPLISLLHCEAHRRGQTQIELAAELNVTFGYIHQLRNGIRQTAKISGTLVGACSRYLSLPPIAVKLLAGALPMSDFLFPAQSEEEVLDQALDVMKADPRLQLLLPVNLTGLSLDAKRALVLLYSELTDKDFYAVRELSGLVEALQHAAKSAELTTTSM